MSYFFAVSSTIILIASVFFIKIWRSNIKGCLRNKMSQVDNQNRDRWMVIIKNIWSIPLVICPILYILAAFLYFVIEGHHHG